MRTSQTGTCKDCRGFTFLELLAVMFIISLLAALVFPSFRAFEGKSLKSDAARIASLLRYLNDSAISSKNTYPLKIDLADGSLSWDGPEGGRTEKFRSLSEVTLQSRGGIREGQVTVFFGPLGINEGLEFLLRQEDSLMKVLFNPISGRAKITTDEE